MKSSILVCQAAGTRAQGVRKLLKRQTVEVVADADDGYATHCDGVGVVNSRSERFQRDVGEWCRKVHVNVEDAGCTQHHRRRSSQVELCSPGQLQTHHQSWCTNQIKSNLKNLYSAPTIMNGGASQDDLGLKILKKYY